jgi:hypothetical protein
MHKGRLILLLQNVPFFPRLHYATLKQFGTSGPAGRRIMRLHRVRRYVEPGYPTRDYLTEHPELLRYVPKRWQSNRLVLGTLSLVIPLILACQARSGQEGQTKSSALRVAPLFIHGEGRGAFGCVVINPPVFLSEDEARQVIQDEAKKAHIEFIADGLTLKDVQVPVTSEFEYAEQEERAREGKNTKEDQPPPKERRQLVLDGYDKGHKIAYEVVSQEDFLAWEKRDKAIWSSVSVYGFKTTAQRLAKGLADMKGDATVAVFYEPAAYLSEVSGANREREEKELETLAAKRHQRLEQEGRLSEKELAVFAKAEWDVRLAAIKQVDKEKLRAQVQDFLQWLKAQGVI